MTEAELLDPNNAYKLGSEMGQLMINKQNLRLGDNNDGKIDEIEIRINEIQAQMDVISAFMTVKRL